MQIDALCIESPCRHALTNKHFTIQNTSLCGLLRPSVCQRKGEFEPLPLLPAETIDDVVLELQLPFWIEAGDVRVRITERELRVDVRNTLHLRRSFWRNRWEGRAGSLLPFLPPTWGSEGARAGSLVPQLLPSWGRLGSQSLEEGRYPLGGAPLGGGCGWQRLLSVRSWQGFCLALQTANEGTGCTGLAGLMASSAEGGSEPL